MVLRIAYIIMIIIFAKMLANHGHLFAAGAVIGGYVVFEMMAVHHVRSLRRDEIG